MQGYWVTFIDGSNGYCEGESEYDCKQIAEHVSGKTVGGGPWRDFTMEKLPYPAKPVLWQFDHPVNGKCPPFCHSPNQCKGRTSCPQSYACSE